MRIATCNIRCFPANDGPNHWELRKELALGVIEELNAEIICFQELWMPQCRYAQEVLSDYDYFGIADEEKTDRPTNAIFYLRSRFEVVSPGGFWLSETPHVSGSSSWNSACVRLVNWLRLIDKCSGREFRVINTHLDHVSQLAREHGADLICEDAAVYPVEFPQLLTGDMNCDIRNSAIGKFLDSGWKDTYTTIHKCEDPGHTFHGFEGPSFSGNVGKMDWVFSRGSVRILDASIVDVQRNGRYPSDHYFVTTDFEL